MAHPRLSLALRGRVEPFQHEAELHNPMKLDLELLEWYDKTNRQMPWRTHLSDAQKQAQSKKERSQAAYRVWVSEIMCQQTQVATVIPYFERWIEKFPTVRDLAKADVEEVRLLWTGLGYYSRATRLLQGAKTVVDRFDGLVPSDPKILQKEVDGVGEYTAAAITSIACGKRVAAIDGNVQRVYARIFAIHANVASKSTKDHLSNLANAIVPADRPGDYNQAVMDLGATICTPKNPKCSECPVAKHCIAYAVAKHKHASERPQSKLQKPCTVCLPLPDHTSRDVTTYPMAKIRKKAREEETAVCILEWRCAQSDDGKFLLLKRPEKGLLAGAWEFPNCDMPPAEDSTELTRETALRKLIATCLGLSSAFKLRVGSSDKGIRVVSNKTSPVQRHLFSHIHRDYLPIHVVIETATEPTLKTGRWATGDALLSDNLPVAMQKIWRVHTGVLKAKAPKAKQPRKVTKAESESDIEDLSPPPPKKRKVIVHETVEFSSPNKIRKVRTIQASESEDD